MLPGLAALLLAAPVAPMAQSGEAVYDVTFTSTWSNQTHPGAFPGGAHYSPLIGSVHGDGISFWQPGGTATPGIERMAETGGTTLLRGEINAAINGDMALSLIQGPGLGTPSTTTLQVTLTPEHHRVTLVTMIAPSPDWFVGTSGLSLMENGLWRDEVVVDLLAWDAGSDSGVAFTSSNQDTQPKEPIALLTSGPFFGTTPLGTMRFTRRRSTIVYGSNLHPAGTVEVSGDPVPGGTVSITLHDPLGVMPLPAQSLIAVSSSLPATFPVGRTLPGLGLGGVIADGELLVGAPLRRAPGPDLTGPGGARHDILIPADPALAGTRLYAQGAFFSAGRIGVTDAVEIAIGLP